MLSLASGVEATGRFLGLTRGWWLLILVVVGFVIVSWRESEKNKRGLAEYQVREAKLRQERETKERAVRERTEAARQRAQQRSAALQAIPKAVTRLRAIEAGESIVIDAAIEHATITTWREAEKFVALWLAKVSGTTAQPTAPGADSGVDVESPDFVAQVKWQAANVGRQVVQQLYGQAQSVGKQALFFSKSGYARTAEEFASGRVALFSFTDAGRVMPVNEAAKRITARFDGALNGQAISRPMVAEAIAIPDPPPPEPTPRPYRPRSRASYNRSRYRR